MVLPPAFVAQLADSAGRSPAARLPSSRRAPAAVARSRAGLARRDWTLFQWWAVVGWPAEVPPLYSAGALAAMLSLVGLAVWRDVRGAAPERRDRPGRVVTLRLPVTPGARAPTARRRRVATRATPPVDRRAA